MHDMTKDLRPKADGSVTTAAADTSMAAQMIPEAWEPASAKIDVDNTISQQFRA